MEYLFSVYWKEYRIGYVFVNNSSYIFSYDQENLKKANMYGFDFLIGFPDINKLYINNKMFPIFESRIKTGERLKRDNIFYKQNSVQKLIDSKGVLMTDNISIIDEKDFNNGKRI